MREGGIPEAIFAETSGFGYGIGRGDLARNRHAFPVNGESCRRVAFSGILRSTTSNRARSQMICPQCRSVDCFRSHRGGTLDFLNSMSGLRPWRCHTCDRRFYAWRVAIRFQGFAHCPRCGNFDLEHISRERVETGTMIAMKRWFGFPAYRCDPCRHRFFSIRRYRRIVPALLESPSSGKVVAS
jgi:hypothetical protein